MEVKIKILYFSKIKQYYIQVRKTKIKVVLNSTAIRYHILYHLLISVFGKSAATHRRVNDSFTDALLQLLNSFLVTVTCKGQIVLVSPSIEQHLGHCQVSEIIVRIFVI